MIPYLEWLKQKQVEDVEEFFKFICVRPNIYGDLSMSDATKESIIRIISIYRERVLKFKNEIEDIKNRVNYGPAPRKSKHDPQNIEIKERTIERMKGKILWAKFHIRNLGWDISDEELEID